MSGAKFFSWRGKKLRTPGSSPKHGTRMSPPHTFWRHLEIPGHKFWGWIFLPDRDAQASKVMAKAKLVISGINSGVFPGGNGLTTCALCLSNHWLISPILLTYIHLLRSPLGTSDWPVWKELGHRVAWQDASVPLSPKTSLAGKNWPESFDTLEDFARETK